MADNSVLMALQMGAGLEGDPAGNLSLLAGLLGNGDLDQQKMNSLQHLETLQERCTLQQKMNSLERQELEEVAQQLFLALKRSEGRLMTLRRDAAAQPKGLRRMRSSGDALGAGSPRGAPRGHRQQGITRTQSGPVGYDGLPEVFKRLVGGQAFDDAPEGVSLDMTQAHQAMGSPVMPMSARQAVRQGSQDQSQHIFDRLYNNAREQRVRKQAYSEIARLSMPNPVPNSAPL
jgi:hypothetical protein